MYRFLARPKWIVFTLVVAAAVVAMVALSLWQLRRLEERREFNAACQRPRRYPGGRAR
jgi:cytochrome oxidase assembly protein ShyY1